MSHFSDSPKVSTNTFMERRGVRKVDEIVGEAGCLWRETPMHDVGIDGQIEYVDTEGRATGRIVAVQIKAGPSYFSSRADGLVRFKPHVKHRNYWASFPLPVVVVLYHPDEHLAIWVDARHQLRENLDADLKVSESQRLTPSTVLDILSLDGDLPVLGFDPDGLLDEMLGQTNGSHGTSQSFFDLFFHGLTDLGHCLYFGMDLFSEIMREKDVHLEHQDEVLSWGSEDYDFLDRYVSFLLAHDLVRLDFDNLRRAAEDGMVGVFLAPLTHKGRALVKSANALDSEFFPSVSGGYRVLAQERLVRILFQDSGVRLLHIEQFKEAFRRHLKS
ncbi:DUF4365 domain-containing protein [Streptomyces sp. AS58]|uniref:DUF4365 domain-containing protein n=1 Tax=Streptomyces sp. AS58 TaxID=1519489 RepID=UPI000AEDC8EA|nr:DUF4365 domain-containing protein [Streptomyces sp. AS58]